MDGRAIAVVDDFSMDDVREAVGAGDVERQRDILLATLAAARDQLPRTCLRDLVENVLVAVTGHRGFDRFLASCSACEESWDVHDLEETTWQQWRCPCCGSWNDRLAKGGASCG